MKVPSATVPAGALILALLAIAAMVHGIVRIEKVPALVAGDPTAWPVDSFRANAYFADPAEIPPGLDIRGSRIDGVDYRGSFTSGWFQPAPRVTLLVAGFPRLAGNRLELEVRDAGGGIVPVPFDQATPRDCWRPWTVAIPRNGTAFRVHAVDNVSATNGWLAVSEPFRPSLHPALLPQTERTLLAFAIQALLFTGMGLALVRGLRLTAHLEPLLVALVAGAAVAALGYLAFWAYFADPRAGRVFSWAVGIACGAALMRPGRHTSPGGNWFQPVLLAIVIGLFYLALLQLYEPARFSFMAANRFVEGLPSDNEIPRAFAERLARGESPRHLWGDWLSSDRPPLQSGWLLLTWPVLQGLGFDADTAAGAGGLCFQLLWVPAVWSLARNFGATPRQALAVAAGISFSGVFLVFSVFVWPKLAAAALVVAACLLWFGGPRPTSVRRLGAGGGCAGLGWLAHGGVAFSLLALVPLVLLHRRQIPLRRWWPAAVLFLVCAAPWLAYQRWYEPPGSRLVKWHLGGAIAIDDRGPLETIRAGYREAGLGLVLGNKWSNLKMQFGDHWLRLPNRPGNRRLLQVAETYYTARAWNAWVLCAIVPLIWIARGVPSSVPRRATGTAAAWLAGGMIAWLALMFLPLSASIHQGTLVTQLLSFTLLAMLALHCHRLLLVLLATLQSIWFAALWIPQSRAVDGAPQTGVGGLALLSGLFLLVVIWRIAWGSNEGAVGDVTIEIPKSDNPASKGR